jgi:outer membrane protein TolC
MRLRLFSLNHFWSILAGWLLAVWVATSAIHRSGADEVPRAPVPILSFAENVAEENSQATPAAMSGTALFESEEQWIDFVAALQLAEQQNPNIGLSRQAIQEALAQQLQARAMLAPTLRAGGDYRSHQGVLQTSSGKMTDVDSSSLYLGNGAMTVAAGTTVIPGVQIFAHLGDGLFEPLAARQLLVSRNFQAQAASNQVLLEVSRRFLDLVSAEGVLLALRLTEKDMDQAVRITREFARTKQGRDADAMRAQTAALLLHAKVTDAEENILTASAELARVLSLDPSIRLRTAAVQQDALLELVDASQGLQELLQLAREARPELAALSAEIARKQIQVKQERTRPLFPTISLGFSAGNFGGGTDPAFGQFGNRTDIDLMAYWTLKNMGVGNWALQKQRLSEQRQTMLERDRAGNLINREVADAQALVIARRQDIDIARERLATAERAFREDLKRIKGLVGLPIELLNSLNRLVGARVDVVRVVQNYNLAQMQLFVALGQTPLAAQARAIR